MEYIIYHQRTHSTRHNSILEEKWIYKSLQLGERILMGQKRTRRILHIIILRRKGSMGINQGITGW